MKIFRKIERNGSEIIYFFNIKLLSYKKKRDEITLEKIKEILNSYEVIEKKLREKIRDGDKVKVAFIVGLPSMFPAKPLVRVLTKSKYFLPSIIIVPDFRFGFQNAILNQKKCYDELREYCDIIKMAPMVDIDDDLPLNDLADIVFLPVPYEISHSKYNLINLIEAGLLPAIVNYGFFRSRFDRERLIASIQYSLFWKVFCETKYNLQEFYHYSIIKGKNTILTGYCKMDDYRPYNHKINKKTVLIAPHHSVDGGFNDVLALSNFEKYSDFFLELPDIYPEIDFIFRPHPALFLVMEKNDFWGKEKTDRYISEMRAKRNVRYSDGGDYFSDFSISDGIIQDCGSYLVEYFYTLKPQCYLLKSEKDIEEKFVELGARCLEHCYIAYDKNNILDFIDTVILEENDPKKNAREIFAKEEIMLNYPNVSKCIVGYFENILGGIDEKSHHLWDI